MERDERIQCSRALARRKQIYVTLGETEITMIFPTNAQTVEEAEDEFSDESRQSSQQEVVMSGIATGTALMIGGDLRRQEA